MIAAQLAALGAILGWIWGLRGGDQLRRHAGRVEFWWAISAFALGFLGPLSGFLGVPSDASDAGALVRVAPLALLGVGMVIQALKSGARVPAFAVFLLLAFGVLAVHYLETPSLMVAFSFALFLPALLSPRDGWSIEALRAGVSVGVSVGLLVLAMGATVFASSLLGPCRLDKCSVWGTAIGAGGTGNAIGMVLAASAGVTILSVSSWYRYLAVLLSSLVLVDLTSSRSALYSWCAVVVISGAFYLSKKVERRSYVRLAAALTAAIVVVLPFLGWSPSSFTQRGALWLYAQELIDRSPLFGYGSSYWVRGGSAYGVPLNYSTHNLALELLVSMGAVGAVAIMISLFLASRGRGVSSDTPYPTALVGVLFAVSMTEVFSAPGRTYLMAGLFVYVLVASQGAVTRQDEFKPRRGALPKQDVRNVASVRLGN